MSTYSGNTIQSDLVRGIVADIKTLTVDRLKKVLRQENQLVSGIKNELQIRLIAHVEYTALIKDTERLHRIKNAVRDHPGYSSGYHANPYPSPYSNHTPASSASPQFKSPTPRQPVSFGMSYGSNRVTFKPSPFYVIQRSLCAVQELKPREQTRDTTRVTLNLDSSLAAQLSADPNLRVMVFCAAESFDSAWKPVDIAFPHHADLKCNQEEVKANLKGLKNKPGSTRPADVTHLLRKKAGFPNSIEMMYALTQKKHYMVVNLVQKKPIDDLINELKRTKALSKDRVLRDMESKSKDDDVIATSSNMSLRDPVQMTRIETPCRSNICKHNECFDAAVYLALQEQAPTWTCPICNRPAGWDNIVYDQFVQDILDKTSKTALQVTVEPDGNWHLLQEEQDTDDDDDGEQLPTKKRKFNNDDDDLIEISSIKSDPWSSALPISFNAQRTPSIPLTPSANGREHASTTQTSNSQQHASNKRQRIDIDLTLSDDDEDDDDPPVSRVKRPSLTGHDSNIFDRHNVGPSLLPPQQPLSFQLPLPRPSSGFGQLAWNGSQFGNNSNGSSQYLPPFGGMR